MAIDPNPDIEAAEPEDSGSDVIPDEEHEFGVVGDVDADPDDTATFDPDGQDPSVDEANDEDPGDPKPAKPKGKK